MKRRAKNDYLAALSQRIDERDGKSVGRWREDREIRRALWDCREDVARELREAERCVAGLEDAGVDAPEVTLLRAVLRVLGELELRRCGLLQLQQPLERDLWFRRGWSGAVRRGRRRAARETWN